MMQSMSYWSISDVFEEAGFNSNEFNGLYGLQTIRGVPKPAFRAMELLQMYAGKVSYDVDIWNADSNVDDTVIVYCLSDENGDGYNLFVANFNSEALDIAPCNISIYVNNL